MTVAKTGAWPWLMHVSSLAASQGVSAMLQARSRRLRPMLRVSLCAAVAVFGVGVMTAPAAGAKTRLSVAKSSFGNLPASMGDWAIDRYTLRNAHGMSVSILTYGGIIQSLSVPEKRGHIDNVTRGFEDIDGYTSPA